MRRYYLVRIAIKDSKYLGRKPEMKVKNGQIRKVERIREEGFFWLWSKNGSNCICFYPGEVKILRELKGQTDGI